ncbi:hypothetical protein [Fodinicola acaciae]|uniref:hypothetical protein n=1 Tax=Fodinicola acaciae TaxID=2681555 RepID=UPI001C9E7176|nr:hypothetical protein [Fodinicola acaciae]
MSRLAETIATLNVPLGLKVLLDAQVVRRRRAGRSVLYYRTPDGDRLIAATTTPP